MSYWLENSMQFDQPDNLSQALLIPDGTTRGFDGSPHTGRFTWASYRITLPKIFQTNHNSNNSNDNNSDAANGITRPVDIKDLGSRCGFCCASALLLVYAMALACSALDKILGLHIFPESTLLILVGSVLAVYLLIGLYVAMPTIVAFIELVKYERSVLAG